MRHLITFLVMLAAGITLFVYSVNNFDAFAYLFGVKIGVALILFSLMPLGQYMDSRQPNRR